MSYSHEISIPDYGPLYQFPAFQPDETFISWAWRVQIASQIGSTRATMMWLFGVASISARALLPIGLDHLRLRLPTFDQPSTEDIIFNHSLYPLFSPFLSERSRSFLKASMYGNKPRGAYAFLGLMRTGKQSLRLPLRFCEDCVAEDQSKVGFAYFHRSHQIPGITLCLKHKKPLTTGCGQCFYSIKCQTYRVPGQICMCGRKNRKLSIPRMDSAAWHDELRIAELGMRFLETPGLAFDVSELCQTYRQRAQDLGLGFGNRIARAKMSQLVRKRYSLSFLKKFCCDFTNENSWVSRIFIEALASRNVIHHLLLINLLFEGFDDFNRAYISVSAGEESRSIPDEPKLRLEDVLSFKSPSIPIPDPNKFLNDTFPIARTRTDSRKDTKRQKRFEFLAMLLRGMDVDGAMTLVQASQNEATWWLAACIKVHESFRKAYFDLLIKTHLEKLKDALAQLPNLSRKEMLKQAGRSIAVLRVLAPDVLDRLIPRRKSFDFTTLNQMEIINSHRPSDHELASEVKRIAQQLRAAKGKPRRVTPYQVAGFIAGGYRIHANNDERYYVETRAALKCSFESDDEFHKRMARWAFATFKPGDARSCLDFVARKIHRSYSETEQLLNDLGLKVRN